VQGVQRGSEEGAGLFKVGDPSLHQQGAK